MLTSLWLLYYMGTHPQRDQPQVSFEERNHSRNRVTLAFQTKTGSSTLQKATTALEQENVQILKTPDHLPPGLSTAVLTFGHTRDFLMFKESLRISHVYLFWHFMFPFFILLNLEFCESVSRIIRKARILCTWRWE